jgi:hypothetical protein
MFDTYGTDATSERGHRTWFVIILPPEAERDVAACRVSDAFNRFSGGWFREPEQM